MYDVEVFFAPVKDGAIIPSKREEDACYDIYACFDEDCIKIEPHTMGMIPTGIASAFDDWHWKFKLAERSSTGKVNMKLNAGEIDAGYRGEWFVQIYNGNDYPIAVSKAVDEVVMKAGTLLYPYKKAIAQAGIYYVPKAKTTTVDYETLKNMKSERGTGSLGSSGK